jgi:hypothetical protein
MNASGTCLRSCRECMPCKDTTTSMLLIPLFLQEGTRFEVHCLHGMDGKLHHTLFLVLQHMSQSVPKSSECRMVFLVAWMHWRHRLHVCASIDGLLEVKF